MWCRMTAMTGPGCAVTCNPINTHTHIHTPDYTVMCFKDSIAVATNSRSIIFITIVSCVGWCPCVFAPIYSGASLRVSVYV